MKTVAFAAVAVLCLFAGAHARPLEGRQLLQSSASASASQVINLLNSGGSQSQINALLQQLVNAPPAQSGPALRNVIMAAGASQGQTGVLSTGLSQVAGQGGMSTAVGNAISAATGAPPSAVQTGNAGAISTLFVMSTNGTSIGSFNVTAGSFTDVQNACASAIATAFSAVSGNSQPASAAASAAAQAIGTAVAQAFAQISGVFSVSGSGVIVANGSAQASALAETTAQAIATAVATSSNGNQQAVAAVQTSAVSSAIAAAFARASTTATQNGAGSISVNVTSVATDVRQAIATAIANALATVGPTSGR